MSFTQYSNTIEKTALGMGMTHIVAYAQQITRSNTAMFY